MATHDRREPIGSEPIDLLAALAESSSSTLSLEIGSGGPSMRETSGLPAGRGRADDCPELSCLAAKVIHFLFTALPTIAKAKGVPTFWTPVAGTGVDFPVSRSLPAEKATPKPAQ